MDRDLLKHRREFQRAINNHKYEMSDEGILFPAQKAIMSGVYVHGVNGTDWREDKNLLTQEGMKHMLDAVLHGSSQITTWYFGLFSGNVTIVDTWTAANFTSNSTEITSTTEGYSEGTRQAFVEAAATSTSGSASTTNSASKAAFTIATASSVSVWGAGLLSSSTRGGTSGTLMSASKFSAVRTLYDTDVFNLGYTVTLTNS